MDSISLASFSIKIKDKNGNYLDLDSLTSENALMGGESPLKDFFNILKDFFIKGAEFDDESNKKRISVEKERVGDRIIYGLINYGPYGKFQKAKNKESERDINIDTAVTQPFYFLFALPCEREKGILILERKGNISIKLTLENWMNKELFNKTLKNYTLEIKRYLPKSVWKHYIDNGEVVAFDFRRIPVNHDKANYLNKEFTGIKGEGSFRLKIEEESRSRAKRVLNKFMNKTTQSNDENIEIQGFHPHDLRAEIKFGNKLRIFNIDGESVYPYMDISKEITNFEKGHPKFEDIHEIANEHANDLLK